MFLGQFPLLSIILCLLFSCSVLPLPTTACTETTQSCVVPEQLSSGLCALLGCTETTQSCVVPEQLSSGLWIILCCTGTIQSCVVPEQLSSGFVDSYHHLCPLTPNTRGPRHWPQPTASCTQPTTTSAPD